MIARGIVIYLVCVGLSISAPALPLSIVVQWKLIHILHVTLVDD